MRVIIAVFVIFLSLASYSFAQSSACPSDVPTSECICLRLGKYYALGGFFDGCNSCECREDGSAICTQQMCPIFPTEPVVPPSGPSSNSVAPAASCLVSNFSSCEGGITPCAFTDCFRSLQCVPHRCNTENNQCSVFCSCTKDSDCLNGGTCIQNEFGVKVCREPPQPASCNYYGRVFADGESFPEVNGCNQCTCINGNVACTKKACTCSKKKPEVQCFVAPCQTANCKLGNDLCINDYCGGCNAKCRCETSDDCAANQQCKAEKSGWSFCVPKPASPTKLCFSQLDCKSGETCQYLSYSFWGKCVPATTAPPASTTTSCAGRVCPAILCANRPRECLHKCSINFCSCSDYCECRGDGDCYSDEKCSSGKCVSRL